MQLQGIILDKKKFQERNLICHLLTRNGSKVSVIFYGGQGGGKKHKPSHLEIGNLISFPLNQGKKKSELLTAREWKVDWEHEFVRKDYKAFYLLSFYVEIIQKVSPEQFDYDDQTESEYFRLLSNAVYYLEEALKSKSFVKTDHLSLFLIKLLHYSGVFPAISECLYCGETLSPKNVGRLVVREGGVSCQSCQEVNMLNVAEEQELFRSFVFLRKVPFRDVCEKALNQPLEVSKRIADYFLTHFQLFPKDLRSYSFIFN